MVDQRAPRSDDDRVVPAGRGPFVDLVRAGSRVVVVVVYPRAVAAHLGVAGDAAAVGLRPTALAIESTSAPCAAGRMTT